MTKVQTLKKLTPDYKTKFLDILSGSGNLSSSANAMGFAPSTISRERKLDPSFDEACRIAIAKSHLELEDEARRRALHGVTRKKYYKDQEIGEEIEYSDRLLMFLMQATDPDRFAKKNNGSVNINQHINIGEGDNTLSKLGTFLKIDINSTGEDSDSAPDAIEGEFKDIN